MIKNKELKKEFYWELDYIVRNWNSMMRKVFRVPKTHVINVMKKFERYK